VLTHIFLSEVSVLHRGFVFQFQVWLRKLFFVGQENNVDEVIDESSEYAKGETPEELLSSPPKVDSEVEVLHEKVTKQIIKEGHGQKPSKYSTCFCKWFS